MVNYMVINVQFPPHIFICINPANLVSNSKG